MAVIEKRGPLQWRARVRRGGVDQSETFTSRGEAEAWSADLELKIRRGTWRDVRPSKRLFVDLAREYLRDITPGKGDAASREASRIRTLCAAKELRLPMGALQQSDVQAYVDRRLKDPPRNRKPKDPVDEQPAASEGKSKKKAPAPNTVRGQTVQHEVNTLSAIWEHFTPTLALQTNPARKVRLPPKSPGRERRLRGLEYQYLMNAAKETYGVSQAMVVAVETSMRLGEVLALRWEGIDMEEQVATVLVDKNGERRSVALSTRAVAALLELKPEEAPATAGAVVRVRPMLTSTPKLSQVRAVARAEKAGKVFQWAASDSFNKTWGRVLKKARDQYRADRVDSGESINPQFLQDLHWHDLRHEGVSRLFEIGLSAFEVATMSGHKTMQMLKRYNHPEATRIARKLG